jgi:hypothetical protein
VRFDGNQSLPDNLTEPHAHEAAPNAPHEADSPDTGHSQAKPNPDITADTGRKKATASSRIMLVAATNGLNESCNNAKQRILPYPTTCNDGKRPQNNRPQKLSQPPGRVVPQPRHRNHKFSYHRPSHRHRNQEATAETRTTGAKTCVLRRFSHGIGWQVPRAHRLHDSDHRIQVQFQIDRVISVTISK